MRESKKGEKTRLPESTYEAWLKSQPGSSKSSRHKNPGDGTFENWLEKRVEQKNERDSGRKKLDAKASP